MFSLSVSSYPNFQLVATVLATVVERSTQSYPSNQMFASETSGARGLLNQRSVLKRPVTQPEKKPPFDQDCATPIS
jgi:hypothetical protein